MIQTRLRIASCESVMYRVLERRMHPNAGRIGNLKRRLGEECRKARYAVWQSLHSCLTDYSTIHTAVTGTVTCRYEWQVQYSVHR